MSLPSDHEYQEAVQNPRQAFHDMDLIGSTPELMSPAFPLPKPRSGNFATVYRMQNRSRSWAVRCFTRTIFDDQKYRYETVSRNPGVSRLPYFAGFQYIQTGIRVRAKWYPIVKMDWIQGLSLKRYIEKNLDNEENMVDLYNKWMVMVRHLQNLSISHGDLQHENVLVVDKELRLIDYDGMYVPELANCPSHENGHPNYQHPGRNAKYFGPRLDNFSHLVIALTLAVLVYDPRFWDRFDGGDECLLFRKSDFLKPDQSKLIQALLKFEVEWVARTAKSALLGALKQPSEVCPYFDYTPSTFNPSPGKTEPVRSGLGSSWIKDFVR